MKVAIIGHGPSLEGAGLGARIDSFDSVIRLKKGWQLIDKDPRDYGTRCDVLMSSTETLGTMLLPQGPVRTGIQLYVGYPKYGWYDEQTAGKVGLQLNADLVIPLNLFNYWNFRFRELAPKHPNVSLGCAALAFAAEEFDTDEIHLFGFDSLARPEQSYRRIRSIPRTGSGPFPNHDWPKENVLVGFIATEAGVAVHFNNLPIHDQRISSLH